ncbi:MAG TPA: indolepyruvate ferredoxin oxidoreductase family protein [Acidimicrobiales bacterium]|nr:indolepyruvate ferredoxin oxidoreductase family protein [Acidimicrobiales bacterium]
MVEATTYALEDRYRAEQGRVYLSGIQALVRIPIEQLRRDRRAGRRTSAFVSGYPGSPLGGFDLELARARRLAADLPIVHVPAVNEELGATAVMGSQLAAGRPDLRPDGVVGVWYGKAPGLDRASDALRHGNFAGASATGGAIALVGDDPACKSSTMPSSSDASLIDLRMPILYPGTVAECLELGLHGVAMSRATGLWSALKIVTPIADATETVALPALAAEPVLPRHEVDGRPWAARPSAQFLGARMLVVEEEIHEVRLELAREYGALNGLNEVTVDPADAWLGCVATGYTYHELREAFRRLGLADDAALARAGIRLLYLRMPVPFDPALVAHFARGLEEVLVVEEKYPTLEQLVRDALYPTALRPAVSGKRAPDGSRLLPSHGLMDADAIVAGLRARLEGRLGDRLAPPAPRRERIAVAAPRTPFFCSGCPHNWGTKVPDGAVVGMGTGCHGMTLLMDEERVGESIGITAMGNEGAHWVGMAPFVGTRHVFQNLGDGTFFHSGQLSIQNAIGAGATMTFKLLYNSTVAMTGGQDPAHRVGVPELAAILLAHGVRRVAITAEDTSRYRGVPLPDGVRVHDRSRIVEVQEELAAVDGVTVLIHDQACAAETRRARKRGRAAVPGFRVVINHRICEGCGDCGDVSNCLSVQPVDTPLGRKTQIDQESCNFDMSCLKGDCPAFMTVEVEEDAERAAPAPDTIPLPDPPVVGRPAWLVRLAGIGGTGVVSAAQIIGTAAMLDGWDVDGVDQTGLSQKAGPVVSDLILTRPGATREGAKLVGEAQADALVAFDELVAVAPTTIAASAAERTVVVASTTVTPTGTEVVAPQHRRRAPGELAERLRAASSPSGYLGVDSAAYARALTGVQTTANLFLVGVAVQRGAVPVSPEHVRYAIELNGVAVEANVAAFEWGRRWAADPGRVDQEVAVRAPDATPVTASPLPGRLARRVDALVGGTPAEDVVALLAADLVDYQDRRYAGRFLDLVEQAALAEARAAGAAGEFTVAVARGYHKLLAYKDEYEVARLMLHPDGLAAARAVGGPDPKVTWHLHPPTLRSAGLRSKVRFGSASRPLFEALARGKRLRGTPLDPFGRAPVRRLERELPEEYAAAVGRITGVLSAGNRAEAAAVASLPELVRGYEELKLRRAAGYRAELARRTAALVAAATGR